MSKVAKYLRDIEPVYMDGQIYISRRISDAAIATPSVVTKYLLSIPYIREELLMDVATNLKDHRRYDLANLDDVLALVDYVINNVREPKRKRVMLALHYALELAEYDSYQ